MTWLITGSSGQLGIVLTQELELRNLSYKACTSMDLDITQREKVLKTILSLSPEVIVNCAAFTDVDGAEGNEQLALRINGDGPENLAIAAKECGAKFIHISTDYVFPGNGHTPWKVSDGVDPKTAYGRTKAEGEKLVILIYPERSLIVRTAWLYSAFGDNFVKKMTRLALNRIGEIRVVTDQIGQPTLANDLAKQIVNLGLSNTRHGIYHLTNSGEATWFELAQEIFNLAGADISRIVPVLSSEYPRPAIRPLYSVLSHTDWADSSLPSLRSWQDALLEAMPAIISAVKSEG